MATYFRDGWMLRRTQRAGMCYFQCKYSNNRNVFVLSDSDFPSQYNVEVRYTAHGRKQNKGAASYRVLDPRTHSYQFQTVAEAFEEANNLMDSWDSPQGKHMPDIEAINRPFLDFAAKCGIDFCGQK